MGFPVPVQAWFGQNFNEIAQLKLRGLGNLTIKKPVSPTAIQRQQKVVEEERLQTEHEQQQKNSRFLHIKSIRKK